MEKMAEILHQTQMKDLDSNVAVFSSINITSIQRNSESEMEDTR